MHSALTVIIDTNLVLQRYQSYLLMADYLWEAGFSKKKKKTMRSWPQLKLLQTQRYCTDHLFKYNALDGILRDMRNS